MSDPSTSPMANAPFANERVLKRLRRRRAADRRFKWYGRMAIGFALAALTLLLASIATQAVSAATYHVVTFDMTFDKDTFGDVQPDSPPPVDRVYGLVRNDLLAQFPETASSPALRHDLLGLVTRLAVLPVAKELVRKPAEIGTAQRVELPLSDDLDLFLKGATARHLTVPVGRVDAEESAGSVTLTSEAAFNRLIAATSLENMQAAGTPDAGSILMTAGRSTIRLDSLAPSRVTGTLLTGGVQDFRTYPARARLIPAPESERTVSDLQIAWLLALKADGRVLRVPHWSLLTHTDSTQPELAGALAAIIGSLLTLLVTASLAIPVGILASVYLEEFAPRNRITGLIEVNINNLAAVPSIVFGLLGAAVFLGAFGLPRSAPVVGGLVLALLILPVVIIASRAALKAVPQSIRDAALAIGASRMQTVFHHVMPLAAPGMLTGAILGMARALGETAPLLLIGMVAFVAEVPRGPTDEATALPVLIYSWATQAERAWEPMTGAVILILLAFLIAMNGVVVFLRRKFERRW
ncbi:phosphate ABC transporter permease PstA [Hyphomonas sp.]|uniref:phosphate ABC transporter permease PstA n=1 Tax=Hyphomonas sp. TaxID=87 RepID=UPI000C62EE73|nr:phosphate ABC transporter permease PstA [Hyphomonas sp.]MAU66749.1 phosphate ABC transporter, permease protein PstA [Hyphomonas sp.]MBM58214.1 phosphate ABC transporter, permease protein PstA [Hyphomonas sp.]